MQVLLFFGAGASRPFGIPTMQEMVEQFEKELTDKGKPEKRLYSKIKQIQEKDFVTKADIESIFSVIQGIASNVKPKQMGHLPYYYISSNNITSEFPPSDVEHASKLKSELETFIKSKCDPQMDAKKMSEIYARSYSALFSALPGNRSGFDGVTYSTDWRAYTTNYDLTLEHFWADYLTLSDHFVPYGESKNQIFHEDSQPKDHAFIKLHGSIDWYKEQSGNIMRINSKFTRHQLEGEVMIFPIQQKDLYLHPWITLFQDLKRNLKTLPTWIVIGYAFNDEFIFEIFKEALVNEKKLVIINPHARDLKKKFPEKLREKIIALPIKFGDSYFPRHVSDFFKGIRTLDIRLRTNSQTVGFKSSLPIQYLSAETSSGKFESPRQTGKSEMYLNQVIPHKDDEVIKCTLEIIHTPPFENDLELQYFTNGLYDAEFSVYINDQYLTGTSNATTKPGMDSGYYAGEKIKIPADRLFVKS